MADITDKVKKVPSKLNPKVVPLSILDKVRTDPKYTQARSVDWFKKKISDLGGNSPSAKNDLIKTTKPIQTMRFIPGSLFIFKYDPKYKESLPFYDTWPCSLIFSIEEDLVRGINFHYLPYAIRGKLFDKLNLIAAKYHNNQQQVMRLNWKLLSNVAKFPEVRPAVKSYLYSHLQSKLIKVPVEDWKTAILLPIESFAKKSLAYVSRDSGQQIRKVISGR
jgi:hypothetical protein